jgi:F-box domain
VVIDAVHRYFRVLFKSLYPSPAPSLVARFVPSHVLAQRHSMLPPLTTSSPAPCPFDNISNEILDVIFDLLPLKEFIEYYVSGKKRRMNQIIVLMNVSRRFRRSIRLSRFWHLRVFQFETLIANYDVSADLSITPTESYRIGQLCIVLLEDPFFASCLEAKTSRNVRHISACILPQTLVLLGLGILRYFW